jgi:hypothetical protein
VRTPADFAALTARQILLFFDQAQRRRSRDRADRIVDVNLAFGGGKDTKHFIDALLKGD